MRKGLENLELLIFLLPSVDITGCVLCMLSKYALDGVGSQPRGLVLSPTQNPLHGAQGPKSRYTSFLGAPALSTGPQACMHRSLRAAILFPPCFYPEPARLGKLSHFP